MKRIALMLLTGAVLANSVSAYANGTAVIMYGRYVTSIDTSNNIGPTAGTEAQEQSTAAAQGTDDAVIYSTPAADASNAEAAATAAQDTSGAGITANAAADTTVQAADAAKVEAAELDRLGIPADATVAVTLKGSANGDTGILTLLTKTQSADGTVAWTKLSECTAKYGKAGLGKSREGDNKTPVGVFKMNTPFGIKEAETGFPVNYIKVDGDNYWNGDSASELYNKLVSTRTYTDFKTSESEHLINYAPYYNYCIDTGYNAEGTAYKGSAIFLHCVVGDENTHGCIAIPEENMKEVLRNYAEGTTYIAIAVNE